MTCLFWRQADTIKCDLLSDGGVGFVDNGGLVFALVEVSLDVPVVVVVSPSVAETGGSSVDFLGVFDNAGAVSVKYDVLEDDATVVASDAAVDVLVETVDSVKGDAPVNAVRVAD